MTICHRIAHLLRVNKSRRTLVEECGCDFIALICETCEETRIVEHAEWCRMCQQLRDGDYFVIVDGESNDDAWSLPL